MELGKKFNEKHKGVYILVMGVLTRPRGDLYHALAIDINVRGDRPLKDYLTEQVTDGIIMKTCTENWTVFKALLNTLDNL